MNNTTLARSGHPASSAGVGFVTGHGVSLRIEGGSLAIKNGFTHYPPERETYRYFRGDLLLPKRIILLDGDGSDSFDVLSWLAEQEITLIRIDWKGDIVCVGSCPDWWCSSGG